MRVLALEPYYGGSHKAFLDGWIAKSRHDWTVLSLPPHHWKWRMRHSAITFAEQLKSHVDEPYDLIFCSDMLNLAAFRGLAPAAIGRLPAVIYFHENQLTYPDEFRTQRDFHFAFDNFQSMLAANAIWFNSNYHREEFLAECHKFLSKFPDFTLETALVAIRERTRVASPGLPSMKITRQDINFQVPHIVWAARWEKDKNPDAFFDALRQLKAMQIPFRLSVVGESFRDTPAVFEEAAQAFSDRIVQWGFLPQHSDYRNLLASSDLFVSTAVHEFFGISAAEAILSGNIPVLPSRLAYPELVDNQPHLLYDGTIPGLVEHLKKLIQDKSFQTRAVEECEMVQQKLKGLQWSLLAATYDDNLETVSHSS